MEEGESQVCCCCLFSTCFEIEGGGGKGEKGGCRIS